jgi:5-methylcytosine-specific restriction endonuclease McrA
MMKSVLALDTGGTPRKWISTRETVEYILAEQVIWTMGNTITVYRSTLQGDGRQTVVEVPPIIAVHGREKRALNRQVSLTNRTLFGRDRNMCCYCGRQYSNHNHLSRDHVIPRSRGGTDDWMNVVTSCLNCNAYKGNRTLAESHMNMLYLPYVPSHHENMILQNRNILQDQMEYLLSGVPSRSRIWEKHKMELVKC